MVLATVSLVLIVYPDLADTMGLAYMAPMGIYEVGLGIWLLTKGLRSPMVE